MYAHARMDAAHASNGVYIVRYGLWSRSAGAGS